MLPLVMGRAATALIGALAGAAVGVVLLVTTHPTSAYLNDAYRQGASFGFVLRYVTLGLVAALLVRALRRAGSRGRVLAGAALAIVLALAIVPPALDTESASEKRRAAAVEIGDPEQRAKAEARAGAIDGCVEGAQRQVEEAGVPRRRGLLRVLHRRDHRGAGRRPRAATGRHGRAPEREPSAAARAPHGALRQARRALDPHAAVVQPVGDRLRRVARELGLRRQAE